MIKTITKKRLLEYYYFEFETHDYQMFMHKMIADLFLLHYLFLRGVNSVFKLCWNSKSSYKKIICIFVGFGLKFDFPTILQLNEINNKLEANFCIC